MEQGFCKFCGTGKLVNADSRDDVNEIVTMECDCEEGIGYRITRKTKQQVLSLCLSPKEMTGMKPITEETAKNIADMSEVVCSDQVDSITVHIEGSTIIIAHKSGSIDVTRKKLTSVKAQIAKE